MGHSEAEKYDELMKKAWSPLNDRKWDKTIEEIDEMTEPLEPKYKAEVCELTTEDLIEIADRLSGGKPQRFITVYDENGNEVPEEEWRQWEEDGELEDA